MRQTKAPRTSRRFLHPRPPKHLNHSLQDLVRGRPWPKVLTDRWIGGPRSHRAELAMEHEPERERAPTGADVSLVEKT